MNNPIHALPARWRINLAVALILAVIGIAVMAFSLRGLMGL